MTEWIPESGVYDNFIQMLSDENIWRNIYRLADAQNMIDRYPIMSYINGKNKGKNVANAIAMNTEISHMLKEEMMMYMEKTYGMIYNKYEVMFELTSRLSYTGCRMCDKLSKFIMDKKVNPNFQTNVGNIFHIVATFHISGNEVAELENKFKKLVDYGCDIIALNKEGLTPLDLALQFPKSNADLIIQCMFSYKKCPEMVSGNTGATGNSGGSGNTGLVTRTSFSNLKQKNDKLIVLVIAQIPLIVAICIGFYVLNRK
jgi:hypothetical protein